jgi:hypothetical protein
VEEAVEDGEEERRGGMEGEGSGLFMDDTEGGWVRVHREVARLDQSQSWQQPRPRRDRDVNKARPFRDGSYMSLGSVYFSAFTCAFSLSSLTPLRRMYIVLSILDSHGLCYHMIRVYQLAGLRYIFSL